MADDRREFAVAAPARRTRWWRWGLAALLAVVAVVQATLLPGPRSLSYHLTDDALVVDARSGLWDLGRTLDRAALGPASPADLQGAQKLRGSDFPELCTGWWRVPAVGEVWLGSSCGPDGVVLEAEGVGTVALTPARPEAFAEALGGGGTGTFAATPPAQTGRWLSALGVGAVALMVALCALMLAPIERATLALQGRTLVVGTAFGRRRVPLRGATVLRAPLGKPAWRLFGLTLPGMHLGLYRVGGATARVLLLDASRAVHVRPAEGPPWVVSPEDPEAFVAALVDRGARRA